MHGYQIIREIDERSRGTWKPSPGSVYPTLQMLADEGLVEASETGGRKTYRLTDAGRDAANKAADADMALQELGADMAGMAYVTATVTVWDADPRIADEKLRLVEKVVQGRDFTAMAETINAVDAWLGSLDRKSVV